MGVFIVFFVGKDGLWLLQLAEKPEAAATQLEKCRGGKTNAQDKRRINIFYSDHSMDDGLCYDFI